jgi:hypothetical protein
MKWMILALVSAAVACSSSAPAPRAEASGVGATKTSFAGYKTFAFAPANPPSSGYEVTERSLEVQRRLTPLVQASLEKRGYTKTEQNPDLLIKITAGSGSLEQEKVQRGNPGEPAPSGFIGVDAYDRATGSGVWHGSGHAEVDPQKIDDTLLALGVEKMLAGFPRRDVLVTQAQ